MEADIVVTGVGGEYMETVTVVAWHVEPGAPVKAGDLLATVETAKSATEIEAPIDGTLVAVNAKVGDEVPVGASLGRIGEASDEASERPAIRDIAPAQPSRPGSTPSRSGTRVVASPLARRVARDRGVDLATVTGTGPGKRIKRRDVDSAHRAPGPSRSAQRPSACPIVLLHGIGATSAIWHAMLADLDPAYPVERFDLPGHGRAEALENPSFEGLVAAVARQFAAAGIAEAHLVGHSLGAAVAMALGDSGAVRARSISLLAPAGLGPEIDGAFLSGFARATKPESLAPWLTRLVADPSVLPAGLAEETIRLRSRPGAREAQERLINALFPDGTQSFDLRPALARLEIPTKLLWGRQDAIIPWRHGLAGPGRAGVHLLGGVGHLAQLEAPALVAALVNEVVRSAG